MPDYTPDELAFLRDSVVPSWNTDGKGIAGGIDLSVRSALFNAPKGEVKRRGQDDEEQDSDDRRFMSRSPDPRKKVAVAPDCCLFPYPFDDEGTPLYPPTDLPDTVFDTFFSVVLYRYTSPTWGDYAFSDTGDDSGGNITYAWIYDFNWLSTSGSLPYGCLIAQVSNRFDEFADHYFVGGVDLVRVSLCQWEGGGRVLDYGISNAYKFSLDGVAKSGDQNKPDGTYGAETVTT